MLCHGTRITQACVALGEPLPYSGES
jgi:hypothetical protein